MSCKLKVDLIPLFKALSKEQYVIIKPSNQLPDYTIGSDIDIFSYDSEKMINIITSFLSNSLVHKQSIEVKDSIEKAHIDLIVEEQINIRFDIYKRMPKYREILIKDSFYTSVIESGVHRDISQNSDGVIIKVPSKVDDFILRYVEYHEFYAHRPDKLKHIEYIKEIIPSEEHRFAFDKLHHYTSFPKPQYREKTRREKWNEKIVYYSELLEKVKHLYKTGGLRTVVNKVKKKLVC